jgi:hypothetical protein
MGAYDCDCTENLAYEDRKARKTMHCKECLFLTRSKFDGTIICAFDFKERHPEDVCNKRRAKRIQADVGDLISRQSVKDWLLKWDGYIDRNMITRMQCRVIDIPSARPEIIHCKDCKYWKDSDGVYRRGFDAESKCPLNLKEVYEGTFYCGMAERRE